MEKVKMIYEFANGDDKQTIEVEHSIDACLHDYDVCEMFEDFMRAIGFSEENTMKYFRE